MLGVGSVIWDLGGGTVVCERGALRGLDVCAIPVHQPGAHLSLCLAGLHRQVFHHAPSHRYKCLFIALGHFPTSKALHTTSKQREQCGLIDS